MHDAVIKGSAIYHVQKKSQTDAVVCNSIQFDKQEKRALIYDKLLIFDIKYLLYFSDDPPPLKLFPLGS